MLNFKEYKDKLYSLIWSFVGGFIAFILTVKIIPITSNSSLKEIVIASSIIGLGAGTSTLYSMYQQYSLRKNLKILVYEDDNEQRSQLVENLKDANYQVIDFGWDGFDNATKQVKKDKNIKVAIVDQIIKNKKGQLMNRQQGFELVRKFRNIDRSDIRCIILTGELLDNASRIGGNRRLAERIDKYLQENNVVDVIHKQLYQNNGNFTQALYTRILRQIDLLLKADYLK